jgi:hypothetical protein
MATKLRKATRLAGLDRADPGVLCPDRAGRGADRREGHAVGMIGLFGAVPAVRDPERGMDKARAAEARG